MFDVMPKSICIAIGINRVCNDSPTHVFILLVWLIKMWINDQFPLKENFLWISKSSNEIPRKIFIRRNWL